MSGADHEPARPESRQTHAHPSAADAGMHNLAKSLIVETSIP
jgi:hypothetical protein